MSSTQIVSVEGSGQAIPDIISVGKNVTMTFLHNEPFLMRVHIPIGSVFTVPPHWHNDHDEIQRILVGKLEYTLNGVTKLCTPDDGEIVIPRGAVHSMKSIAGVETIIEERTEPMDEKKELFFRNIFAHGTYPNMMEMMQVFWYGDAYIALPGGFRWLDKLFVKVMGYYLAPLFGCKLAYESAKKV